MKFISLLIMDCASKGDFDTHARDHDVTIRSTYFYNI